MMPEFVKAAYAFNRKTLRRTELALFDNDIFQVKTKILDRDTLEVTTLTSHYTKPSMAVLSRLYNELSDDDDFCEDGFKPKSLLEKERY